MRRFPLALLFAALAVFACSGSKSPSGGSPGGGEEGGVNEDSGGAPAPAGCTALATAFCKIEAQCDTVDMQINFAGDESKCIARTLFSCPSTSAPGAGNTPSTIAACATTVGQIADCDTFRSYLAASNLQICPPVLGTLTDGTSCDDDSQCKGGFCGESSEGGTCGACAEKPSTTSCQENSNCPSGQLCNASSACVAAGGAGATCDSNDPTLANQPCAPYLYCKGTSVDGGAVTNGQCSALGTVGEACDFTDPDPECADGFTCASANQCVKIQFVGPGATCDQVLLVCAGGACDPSAGDAATDTCRAFAADGASCASDGDCELDSVCIGTTCTPSFTTCEVE
jgi:hypothetical protein